jgi:hypothetical protein
MNRMFLLALVLGLGVVGTLTWLGFWTNRGSQVRLEASIVKARLVRTDEKACVAVFEVRIKNPASVPFVIRSVQTTAVDAAGAVTESDPVPQIDLDRVLQYYPQTGPRFNDVLHGKAKLLGGVQKDWTVGASFHVSEQTLEARQRFEIVIEDVDGVVVKVAEKR